MGSSAPLWISSDQVCDAPTSISPALRHLHHHPDCAVATAEPQHPGFVASGPRYRGVSTPVSWRQGPDAHHPHLAIVPTTACPARRRLPCDGAHEVRQEGRDTEEEECGQEERAERANQAHGEFFGACLRVDQARASLP